MIVFKKDERIAFNGIKAEDFSAGVEYDLSDEQVAILKDYSIEFEATEGLKEKPKKRR